MTTNTLHPLAADYLDRLERAGGRLPRGRRIELVAEIEAHLLEAVGSDASNAEALTALDRLGEPEAIIDAEQPIAMVPADPRGTKEWAAIILLSLGGFVAGVGWLAGLILLWGSQAWTSRDKWIGTLIIPGGLATAVLFGQVLLATGSTRQTCFSTPNAPLRCTNSGTSLGAGDYLGFVVAAILLLAPFATAAYLARRAAKSPTKNSVIATELPTSRGYDASLSSDGGAAARLGPPRPCGAHWIATRGILR